MMLGHIARWFVVCAALLAAALPLAAQTVTPGNRVLVIDAGKSGVIKVQDTEGCSPTWTAVSSDTGVATVTPDDAPAGKARTFKVKAAKDVFGTTATVGITLMGTGAGCSQTTQLDVTVVVVRNQKHAEQMAKQSAAQGLKAARKARKLEEKALSQQFNDLLAQAKQDLADAETAEGPGAMSKEQILRNAFINGFILQLAFLSAMMSDYVSFTTQVRFEILNAVLNYAYLPFLAVTLLVGGGGIWDGFVAKLLQVSLLSAGKAFSFYRVFLAKLALLAVVSGVPLSHGVLPFQQSLCFPPVCGPSGGSSEAEAEADAEGGVLNPVFKFQLLMLLTWTQFLGSPAGSVVVGGLADPAGGDIDVSLQPEGGGLPIAGTAVAQALSGVWWLLFGTGGTGDPLAPGKYTVIVTQNGTTYTQPVDVAAR